MQKPLAPVVIGGLIFATLLTLVVLPALYVRFAGEIPSTRPAGLSSSEDVIAPIKFAAE